MEEKRTVCGALLGALVLFCVYAPSADAARVALVIGNGDYQNETPLHNPVNDARLIGTLLRETLKFDSVTTIENVRVADLDRLVDEFVQKARDADSAVFYFSGHGMQDDDRHDYLLPVDAVIGNAHDLKRKALSVEDVMGRLDALGVDRPRVTLLVLDACRNNPYAGNKGGAKGLARIEASDGMLIAFATQEDHVAQDGDDVNSPYAKALAQALSQRQLPVMAALDQVREQVETQTHGYQKPTRTGDLKVSAYLVPPIVSVNGSGSVAHDPIAAELAAFHAAEAANTVQAWQIFKRDYPSSAYVATADIRMGMLTQSQSSAGQGPSINQQSQIPGTGSLSGSSLPGTVWKARFQPNVVPVWKDCPMAQISLSADQLIGQRCSPSDPFVFFSASTWSSSGSMLKLSFPNGWIYQYNVATDLRKELSATAPADPGHTVFNLQYAERIEPAFGHAEPSAVAGTGSDASGLDGTVWRARFEPNTHPWWKACPNAEISLASRQRMGFRCTPNDAFAFIADNDWHSDGKTLEIRFSSAYVYRFKLDSDLKKELRAPAQVDPGIVFYIRKNPG